MNHHTISQLINLGESYGMVALQTILKTALIWGAAGFIVSIVLCFLASKLGWMSVREIKKRWAQWIHGLVLFFVCVPLIAFAGAITGTRSSLTQVLTEQVANRGLARSLGAFFISPLVLSRMAQNRGWSNLDMNSTTLELMQQKDVSFLFNSNEDGFSSSSREMLQSVLKMVHSKSESDAFGQVFDILLDTLDSFIRDQNFTKSLLADLKKDSDGHLSFWDASGQVGNNFFHKTFLARLKAYFNQWIGITLVVAVGVWLATIGLIRLLFFLFYKQPDHQRQKPNDDHATHYQ